MKKLRMTLSAMALVASAWLMPAFAQDFVGKWNTTMKSEGMGEMKSVMVISKDEEGEYKLDLGNAMAEIKGVYVNKNVMTIQVTAMGMDIPFELTLTEEDTLEGVIEVADISLSIKATREVEEKTE